MTRPMARLAAIGLRVGNSSKKHRQSPPCCPDRSGRGGRASYAARRFLAAVLRAAGLRAAVLRTVLRAAGLRAALRAAGFFAALRAGAFFTVLAIVFSPSRVRIISEQKNHEQVRSFC